MRWFRRLGSALLMATLAKPVTRVVVARWRKRARESGAARVVLPMQGLLEAALVEELARSTAERQPSPSETSEASAGRGTMGTLLIAGAVVAAIAISAVAVAAVIRRRREAREAAAWVAVPVETPAEEAEEGEEAEGSLAEEALAE